MSERSSHQPRQGNAAPALEDRAERAARRAPARGGTRGRPSLRLTLSVAGGETYTPHAGDLDALRDVLRSGRAIAHVEIDLAEERGEDTTALRHHAAALGRLFRFVTVGRAERSDRRHGQRPKQAHVEPAASASDAREPWEIFADEQQVREAKP